MMIIVVSGSLIGSSLFIYGLMTSLLCIGRFIAVLLSIFADLLLLLIALVVINIQGKMLLLLLGCMAG